MKVSDFSACRRMRSPKPQWQERIDQLPQAQRRRFWCAVALVGMLSERLDFHGAMAEARRRYPVSARRPEFWPAARRRWYAMTRQCPPEVEVQAPATGGQVVGHHEQTAAGRDSKPAGVDSMGRLPELIISSSRATIGDPDANTQVTDEEEERTLDLYCCICGRRFNRHSRPTISRFMVGDAGGYGSEIPPRGLRFAHWSCRYGRVAHPDRLAAAARYLRPEREERLPTQDETERQ